MFTRFFLGLLLLTFSSLPAFAHTKAVLVKTVDLYESPDKYDKRKVIIVGEAIGDIIFHEKGAWININDDIYAKKSIAEGGKRQGQNSGIGVWVSKKEAKKISFLGDYFHKGDIVQVEGIFNKDCNFHPGEMDIHAVNLTILKKGRKLEHPLNLPLAFFSLVLLAVAAVGFGIRHYVTTRPGFRRIHK